MYQLGEGWPTLHEVDALVHLSSGLFIFAATAVKFIQDEIYSDPQGQLACLLSTIATSNSSSHQLLDQLYLQVLNNAYPDVSTDLTCRLKIALGSIVLLQSPLSPLDIEQLLGLNIPLRRTLQHSPLYPTTNGEAICPIHPSFFDFLMDPAQCSNQVFLMNPEMLHSLLAQTCLTSLKMLKRDICEVENLPELVQQHISPILQHVCSHWATHLSCGLLSDRLLDSLEEFCTHTFCTG